MACLPRTICRSLRRASEHAGRSPREGAPPVHREPHSGALCMHELLLLLSVFFDVLVIGRVVHVGLSAVLGRLWRVRAVLCRLMHDVVLRVYCMRICWEMEAVLCACCDVSRRLWLWV
mmetsp:Transcript_28681/g.92632  ORF Transcript_28681/g.92632 Transcript_28681/m.92632 type:complete len:118 (+) Transcript_28681:1073-1426(+)